MDDDLEVRRRSPGWVRAMSERNLHSLAGRLLRDFASDGLSARQDWLLSAALSELEYRRRRWYRWGDLTSACHCWMCLPTDQWSQDPRVDSGGTVPAADL